MVNLLYNIKNAQMAARSRSPYL